MHPAERNLRQFAEFFTSFCIVLTEFLHENNFHFIIHHFDEFFLLIFKSNNFKAIF